MKRRIQGPTIVAATVLLLTATPLCAQLHPGFDPQEAAELSALCAGHTFRQLYGSDAGIRPEGYQRVYESPVMGMDNMFQVFRKGPIGVVEIRGSTAHPISWLENAHSAMIPAVGEITIDQKVFPYHFADDTAAAVHAGYALGIAFIADDVMARLRNLADNGVSDVIITGHSQGGALALLMRAYIEHLPKATLGAMRFKTYAFANPMVGNRAFVAEFDRECGIGLGTVCVVNPEDPVPHMPLAYNDGELVSMDMLQSLLLTGGRFDTKGLVRNATFQLFRNKITGIASYVGSSVEKRIAGTVGEVHLPPYRRQLNYSTTRDRVELEPFPYPVALRDSSILKDKVFMRSAPRNADGTFADPALYKKEPSFFQHKPYNYHVAILKRYFPQEYYALKRLVLPEDL